MRRMIEIAGGILLAAVVIAAYVFWYNDRTVSTLNAQTTVDSDKTIKGVVPSKARIDADNSRRAAENKLAEMAAAERQRLATDAQEARNRHMNPPRPLASDEQCVDGTIAHVDKDTHAATQIIENTQPVMCKPNDR